MRILVVTDTHTAVLDARRLAGPDVNVLTNPDPAFIKGETEVIFAVLRSPRDLDRWRGCRFDMIIEHESFNPLRSYVIGNLVNELRVMVLR